MLNREPRYTLGAGNFPVRNFLVHVGKSEFGQFERQMSKFGAAFGFDNKSKAGGPDPYDIVFYMTRNEVDLVGTDDTKKSESGLKYSIGFYPKVDGSAPPPSPENVDVLVEGLKKFLAPVEGAVITEDTSSKR